MAKCEPPDFKSAGPHFSGMPGGHDHTEPVSAVRPFLLTEGRVVAYRVMDSVIESIETVGPPIRMWVLEGKTWRQLSDDEMAAIRANVGLWKAVERESLAEVMGATSTPEVVAPATT